MEFTGKVAPVTGGGAGVNFLQAKVKIVQSDNVNAQRWKLPMGGPTPTCLTHCWDTTRLEERWGANRK